MRPYLRTSFILCALFTFFATDNNASVAQTSKPATGVSVKLTPVSSTIGVGANRQLNATVSGSTNQGVTWTVNGIANGNATFGTVDATTQLYFAPASVPNPQSFKITATSTVRNTAAYPFAIARRTWSSTNASSPWT